MHQEGVSKFSIVHQDGRLCGPASALHPGVAAWRTVACNLGMMGADPRRYEGLGFGNISARLPPYPGERGHRHFVITGTQTGLVERLGVEHLCVVERYDARKNELVSRGPIRPSSESLTHGAIYDLDPRIRFVIHGHSPSIWNAAKTMRTPTTDPTVPYGTPQMAFEIARLYRNTSLADKRLLVMGGHEDGIIAFGKNAESAGATLVRALARAYEMPGADFTATHE